MAIDTNGYLSVTEAARILGLSTEQVRCRLREGKLAGHHIGNQWFVEARLLGQSRGEALPFVSRKSMDHIRELRRQANDYNRERGGEPFDAVEMLQRSRDQHQEMGQHCLDASVVVAWLFEEHVAGVEAFFDALTSDDDVYSAALLYPECVSNVREAVFAGRVSPDVAQSMVDELLTLEIRFIQTKEVSARAYDIATRFDHKNSYDAHYVAAVESDGGELVTRDRGMRHAAQESGVPVRFLT